MAFESFDEFAYAVLGNHEPAREFAEDEICACVDRGRARFEKMYSGVHPPHELAALALKMAFREAQELRAAQVSEYGM